MPAHQITSSTNAKNSLHVEVNEVRDFTCSLVTGGSIDAFRNHIKEKVRIFIAIFFFKRNKISDYLF